MKTSVKVVRILFSFYCFLIFIILMFIVFPLTILCSFFGKVTGGNMIYSLCKLWSNTALFLWGIRPQNIYEAAQINGHAVIYTFNHISYLDIPMLLSAFGKEHIRILGKAELGKIPVFGYIYRKAAVSVNRQSEEGRLQSVLELKKVLSKHISIVIAPEGTFNTSGQPLKEFYNGAFRIAVETSTPIQPVLFLDTYDRLNYKSILSFNPGRSRTVFLKEILPGTDAQLLKQKVFTDMEAGLRKYNASWIERV